MQEHSRKLNRLKKSLATNLAVRTYGLPKTQDHSENSYEIKFEFVVAEMTERVKVAEAYWQSEEGIQQMLRLGLNPQSIIEFHQKSGQIVVGICEQLNPLPTVLYSNLLTADGNSKCRSELNQLKQFSSYLSPIFTMGWPTLKYQQMSGRSVTNPAYFRDFSGKKLRLIPDNITKKKMNSISMHTFALKKQKIEDVIQELSDGNYNLEIAECLQTALDSVITDCNQNDVSYLVFVEEYNKQYIKKFLNSEISYYYIDEIAPGKLGGFFKYHVEDPERFFSFLGNKKIIEKSNPTVRIMQENNKYKKYRWNPEINSFVEVSNHPNLNPDIKTWNQVKTDPDIVVIPLMKIEYFLMHSGIISNIYGLDDGTFIKPKKSLMLNIRKFTGNNKLLPLLTTLYEITFNYGHLY